MPSFRMLPSIHTLLQRPPLQRYPEALRLRAARIAVEQLRAAAANGWSANSAEEALARSEELAERIADGLAQATLRPAINLTGVVLHTGLGRARLAESAARHVAAIAGAHSVLELDLDTGRRGDRQDHVRGLLRDLTGAEDALVVNNNAAAVLLTLRALCEGRQVVLSRGQMVEIGGSFRMPEIVTSSGCQLVEVGCTNKTRCEDFERAITPETAAFLHCHPSNFQVVGFTEHPTIAQLADLAHSRGLILIDDAGSGCFLDTSHYGLPAEPTVSDSLRQGADIVTSSGDKLLGGPQAGIVAGRSDLIARLRVHPMARALRVDKLTLAGLEATLRLYHQGRHEEIPVWRAIATPLQAIRRAALRLAKAWPGASRVERARSEIGGGALPGAALVTWRVGLLGAPGEAAARALRAQDPPIIGYVEDGIAWLDPRTATSEEIRVVSDRLHKVGEMLLGPEPSQSS